MRKRKIFEASFECGNTLSFEVFKDYEGAPVTMGGENVDDEITLGPHHSVELTKNDVTELFVVFRELLKEIKK